jgi:hypothetical protein
MGIQDVTGWIFVVGGAANAGRAVPQLVRARRSEAPADAIAAGARIRPGYAMPDVDTFLDEVAHASW